MQRKRSRRKPTWPDLSTFDLSNPIDIAKAHELLVAMGHAHQSTDGLHQVALAAVVARRFAKRNTAGYFAAVLRQGFGKFGLADRDRAAAKRILREIYGWEHRTCTRADLE